MVGSREPRSRSRDRDRDLRRDRDRHRSDRHRSSRRSSGHSSRSRRSPDSYYRTDNSDDDSYDNSRRNRSHDHRRHDSDRSRSRHRSRDRSRSRDRDSRDRERLREDDTVSSIASGGANAHNTRYYNDYNSCEDSVNDKNDGYDRDKDRNRNERSFYQKEKREETPNNTLMIRGLAAHITEPDIISKLAEHSLQAKDIRLMRKKETGISRGFAFVEFANLDDAIRWKEVTQGYLLFGEEYEATVHYSIPKDSLNADKNIMKNDWTCYKCGVNNFKRREECFKCGTPKEESLANDTGDEISLTPTNALLFRNLSPNTTEARILTILGSMTALPIKSIRILRDPTYNVSRGICLVELHTTLEASQLFTLLSSMSYDFIIDDYPVQVNYGKRNVSLAHITTNTSNAATVALAAAQWRNLGDDTTKTKTSNVINSGSKQSNSLGTVSVNGVEYQKFKEPDVTSFQFDETSGYYYDSSTGFYYDSNTQYYYNPTTQKYMYWDASNQTYLSIDSDSQTSEETKKEKSKDSKQDKVKIAKKIAKDMEKWAKTLNQKKETSRLWTASEPPNNCEVSQPSVQSKSSTADAGFALMEQMSSIDTESTFSESKLNIESKNQMTQNAFQLLKEEENRLLDLQKMACLLCKRQFPSSELLTKHQQLSELHKSNLNVLKHRVLTEEQIEELDRSERESGYRDRAKERRKKYGLPETPEINFPRSKYVNEMNELSSAGDSSRAPISSDNIGSKMLKAMGWTEGTGLGKANQGISNIIEVERRTEGVGLGMNASTPLAPGETYKDAVRRTMQMRFKQMD